MVSKWERGEKRPSRLYQECLRLLFNDPELFGAGDDAMNRRQWLRGTAAVGTAMLLAEASPGDNGGRFEDGTIGQLLADATAESVELSRQTEASDLGPATLEHLDLAVERLGLVYMTTPPGRCWMSFVGTTAAPSKCWVVDTRWRSGGGCMWRLAG
jgi:hypothetical protein